MESVFSLGLILNGEKNVPSGAKEVVQRVEVTATALMT